MPHMNVLDLAVFPKLSVHNRHLIWYLREIQVSKEYDIWKIAAKILEELPIYKIANVFCLGKIIADNFLKFKGTICFRRSKGRTCIWIEKGV